MPDMREGNNVIPQTLYLPKTKAQQAACLI